jgi:hypothetical protein
MKLTFGSIVKMSRDRSVHKLRSKSSIRGDPTPLIAGVVPAEEEAADDLSLSL